MNEMLKTVTIVVVSLALTGAAWVTTRDRSVTSADFNDQGQPFFAEFKDPLACTDLEVVNFDPATATSTRFRVMYKDNKWVIPSHYNYPADARDRLSKTASSIMDLAKDTIRSDRVEEQEGMGVIDPLDTKSSTLTGRGKRITLRDSTEKVLADFIVGNEIKGVDRKDGKSQYYVRVPDQRRTYGVNIKPDLSTKFADWIETNLLKVEASKIRRVLFDNYKLAEQVGADGRRALAVERGEKVTIERKDATSPWTTSNPIPAGQELNEEKLRGAVDGLGDLKIVGVRPKPPGLTDPNDPNLKLTRPIMLSLQDKGFFITRQGLFSDQGDVLVTTDEGVVYTLRYGGPIFGTGDELTAGTADDVEKKEDDAKKKDAAKKAAGTTENRFLMVTVSFDPSIIPPPQKPQPKPAQNVPPGSLPADAFAPDPKDPKVIAQEKEAEEKAKKDENDYQKKIEDGKKRVTELAARFGPWYYVTPGDSFAAINLDSPMIFKIKGPPTEPNPGFPPGGFPGQGGPLPRGMGGLPPMHP